MPQGIFLSKTFCSTCLYLSSIAAGEPARRLHCFCFVTSQSSYFTGFQPLLHSEHPLPFARFVIVALYLCPRGQIQCTLLLDDAVYSSGPFLFISQSHSRTRSGRTVARSVSPFMGRFPEQYGQPLVSSILDRACIEANHSWPFSHFHHTIFEECGR